MEIDEEFDNRNKEKIALMRRDEALVFKCYDSQRHGCARFTAHASFEDPNSAADAPPRESIEVRTLVIIE